MDTRRYIDEGRLAQELGRIFAREPQLVGCTGDLPGPGSYATTWIGGRDVLLVRGDDGVARAFLNACRHRGARVVDGCGTAARFACPYHRWTYDTSGARVGLPDRDAFALADEAPGLVALPLDERHGLLVLAPAPDVTADVDAFLGRLGSELVHFDLARLHPVETRRTTVACNWKLLNDMGMEGYHVPYLHASSLQGSTLRESIHDSFGRHQRIGFASPEVASERFLDAPAAEQLAHLTLTTFLYPATIVVVGGASVVLQRVAPAGSPGRSELQMTTYSWAPLDEAGAERGRAFFTFLWNLVIDEDVRAQEGCQRAFASGLLPEITFGANEPALHALHHAWDEALG